MVDLSGVAELRGIKEANGGLEIGAMTTLTEVANHALVKERFALLAEAAGLVASPQIRNQGTLGGNVAQDARCWYYRAGWPCYRAGGNICYADTPTAINREHAIFEADRCVAVNPSDTAPALVALDAQMVVNARRTRSGHAGRGVLRRPGVDITRMTALRPGDLLTAIRIPGDVGGQAVLLREGPRPRGVGLRAAQRRLGHQRSGNTIGDCRIVVNGVAARPYRLEAVESVLKGRARNEETADGRGDRGAGRGAAAAQRLQGAADEGLVKRAIRGADEWTS